MFGALQRGLAALVVTSLVACGGGGGGGSETAAPAANRAPRATVLASGDVGAVGADVHGTLGGMIRLDGTASSDDDHDTLSYEWTLVAKPAASQLVLPAAGAATLEWRPDAIGVYTVALKVSDSKGGSSTQQLTITVDNHAPVSSLAVTAQFTAVPMTAPTQAVTVGASIVLDATASTDPDGHAVTVTFELTERPAASSAALTTLGKTARLATDTTGLFKVKVKGSDGRGGSFESLYTFNADNRAPNPVVATAVQPLVADAGQGAVQASVGYDVVLNGTGSSDPDGDPLTHGWLMTSRPPGSAAALSSANGTATALRPDVLGNYVVTLTVTDSRGAKSVRTTVVEVNNRRPVAQITTNATPLALPSAPNVRLPLGTEVTLRGSASTDADGDTLSYAWSVDARPAGSTALLSAGNVADPRFTADQEGSYIFRLRVTDSAGAFSERTIGIDVGTHAPVAMLDRNRMSLLVGSVAQASASLSFDDDGDALSFEWTLDAKPVGSSASIATANTQNLSFTPDVPGTYVAAVTVRDARSASVGYVTIRALAQITGSVTLDFLPDDARYSTGLDKLVAVATNPNTVRIIDPFIGSVRSVALPVAVKNFSLSPDGKLAVVLHEGLFSLIDLDTATLIRTSATGGAQTDAFVTNSGVVFLIGQTGGQWVDESVVAIDGRTGAKIVQTGGYMGMFYGTQYGVFADRLNKVFLMEQGLSPSDISYFSFNPATLQVTDMGDSPYHGDYSMAVPLFLSGTQDLLFTAYGNFFRTDTLAYAGQLSGVTRMLGFTHSSSEQEALVLQAGPSNSNSYPYPPTYPSAYKRFTGSLLLPDGELALPQVNGAQSYGIKIFHSAAGSHVVLVQTGSNEQHGAGAQYHVIVR